MKLFKYFLVVAALVTSLVACGTSADSAADFIESGKKLLAEGQPEKARLEFKNAVQVDPNVAESYYQLALLDEKAKNWKAMFSNLLRVEQLDPKHHDAIIKLGQLYLLSGELPLAMEQVNKVMKDDENHLMAWILKSSIEFKREDYGSAMSGVERALKMAPASVEAISLKAMLLNKQGKPKEAIAFLSSALTASPEELPLTIIKLSILEEQKDYAAMETVYEELKAKHATETWVFVSLAKLYNLQGKYDKAKGVLEGFVKAQPDNKEAKLLLVSLVQEKEPEKAIELLSDYIKQDEEDFSLRLTKVQLLMTIDKTADAISELKQIAALDETSESGNKANVMLATFDMQNKNKEAALQKLNQVLARAPEDEGALLMMAKIEVLDKNIDSAVTRLRIVLRNNPESEQALVLLAQAYMNSGSDELAEDSFRQVLAVNPGNTVAALSITQGLMKSNELDRAEIVLMKALNKNPNNDEVLQALAQVRLLKKDWLGTQSIVDTLLKADKASSEASYLNARLSQAQEHYAEAIEEYKKVLETRPQFTRALQGLAFCSMKLNQKDELLAFLTEFNTKNPGQFAGYAIQSDIFVQDKAFDKAITVLKEGLSIEPKWVGGYSALASVYLNQGEVDKAVSVYKERLVIAPNNNGISMQLASLYEKNYKFSEAKELYEGVLERDKNIELAINNLASLLTDQFRSDENLKKAEAMTERFKSSGQPYYLDSYAWVRVQLGELDKTQFLLERVVSLSPEVAVFNYHLGALYAKQKKMVKAEKYLKVAKELAEKQGDKETGKKVAELLVSSQ